MIREQSSVTHSPGKWCIARCESAICCSWLLKHPPPPFPRVSLNGRNLNRSRHFTSLILLNFHLYFFFSIIFIFVLFLWRRLKHTTAFAVDERFRDEIGGCSMARSSDCPELFPRFSERYELYALRSKCATHFAPRLYWHWYPSLKSSSAQARAVNTSIPC